MRRAKIPNWEECVRAKLLLDDASSRIEWVNRWGNPADQIREMREALKYIFRAVEYISEEVKETP